MNFKNSIAIICLIVINHGHSFGQEVTIETEKSKYKVDEGFEIGFKINSQIDSVHVPQLKGLTILYGPNTSENSSFMNGVRKSQFILSYHVIAKKKGKIKIKSPIYFVNGSSFKGKPIKLKISKKGNQERKPEKNVVKGTHYS